MSAGRQERLAPPARSARAAAARRRSAARRQWQLRALPRSPRRGGETCRLRSGVERSLPLGSSPLSGPGQKSGNVGVEQSAFPARRADVPRGHKQAYREYAEEAQRGRGRGGPTNTLPDFCPGPLRKPSAARRVRAVAPRLRRLLRRPLGGAGPPARGARLPGGGLAGRGRSLLGAAGLLTRPSLLLFAAAAPLAAAPEWRPLLGDAGALAAGPRRVWLPCAVVAALPSLALALYPPTGFDALLYHLPAAGRFAASGRIALAPELRFPAFPWLNEVLFAAALRLQDDVPAQLVEGVVHLGTAGLLWEWGRRRFGAWGGGLAAALWLGSPLATWLAASAYVEPLVALFPRAAAAALDLAARAHATPALPLPGRLA